jgi:signal transduction histidine kinase
MTQTIILLLHSVSEAAAIVFASAAFLNVTIDRRVAYIAIIDAVTIHFIRRLPLSFGFHTILAIILLTILLTYFYQKKILSSFISILKTFILLSIFEFSSVKILVYLFDKPVKEFLQTPFWKTVAIAPQIILLFLVGWITLKLKETKG